MVELRFYIDAKKDLNDFYKGFLEIIKKTFPSALPARYGLVEPPEYGLSEKGEEHFLDLLYKNRNIVWYGTFPVKYVLITDWRANEPYYRYAHRPHKIAIWIDEKFYQQNGLKRKVIFFFIEASKFFDVIYAEINEQIDSDRFELLHNMTKKNFWQGEFSYMGTPCIIGKPYCEFTKKENGIILTSSKNLIYFAPDRPVAEKVFIEDFLNSNKKTDKSRKLNSDKKIFSYQPLSLCKVMRKDNIDWNSEESIEYERWFYINLDKRTQYLLDYVDKISDSAIKEMYNSGNPECLTIIWEWFLNENERNHNSFWGKKNQLSKKMELILMDISFLWGNLLVQNCKELGWHKMKKKNYVDYNLIQIGKFSNIVPDRKRKYYYYIDPFRIVDSVADRIFSGEQQNTDLKNEYLYWKDLSKNNN